MTVPDIIIIFIGIFDWTNKPQNIYIDIYFFVWVSCCTIKLFFGLFWRCKMFLRTLEK